MQKGAKIMVADINCEHYVRAYRVLRNISQAELAVTAGLSKSTISGIEQDPGRSPNYRTLRKLSIALNISIETLVTDPLTYIPHTNRDIDKGPLHGAEREFCDER